MTLEQDATIDRTDRLVDEVVRSYVAVWNEGDPEERRRRIRQLWAAEGTSCYRLLDARGHEAIEQRVAGSWAKWLSDGKYRFRAVQHQCNHSAVRCEWEMVQVASGEAEAGGLSFLLLDEDGRIRNDYQFNPSANDAEELVRRYITVLNTADETGRFRLVERLWAPDARLMSREVVCKGRAQIAAWMTRLHERAAQAGVHFSAGGRSQRHHQVARTSWRLEAGAGDTLAASDLLIFDHLGRIQFDYQFDDPT